MALTAKVSNSSLDPRIITPGGVPTIIHMPEAASQTYKAGSILQNSSGTAAELTAGQAMGDVNLVGIALKDSTGTTAADVPILIPDYNSEILARAGTSGTAATVVAATYPIGDGFDFWVDASGYLTVDSGTETNPKVVVLGYVYDGSGALTQWLRLRPIPAVWASLADVIS